MAYTQQDLDTLEKAIAKGVLSVRMGDKTVQYRSIAELQAAHSMIKKQLNKSQRRRAFVARTSKGI
ncbi:MAG: hypothetical protein RBS36_04180 [Thiomicrospira sp.]|jgi:hypothetical protein|nr:hypothetical protein [Thiomicrospira sp.]